MVVDEYIVKESDERGIRHWVKFKYDRDFINRVKQIPGSLRSFDPVTKMWGFNDKGWNLFCAISNVKLPYSLNPDEEVDFRPRKINTKLEEVDWEKFRRPPVGDLPELYPYEIQKIAISQIIRNKGQGLFFDVGLGKTYTAICAAKELIDRGEVKQVLIISLVQRVVKQWAKTLDRMGYSYTLIVKTKNNKMNERPQLYSDAQTDFVLTLYTSVNSKGKVNRAKNRSFAQVFVKKAEKGPQMVIADELHKLGDTESVTFKEFHRIAKKAKYRVPCTGTIIKSTPEKSLLILRFIAPRVFSNKGVFEEAFMVKEDGYFGAKTVGYKNLNRLREIIHSYGTVALKKDHLKDLPELLPPKQIMVETSKDSLTVLKSIRGDGKLKLVQRRVDISYADLQDLYIRIHQALICPSIFSDGLFNKDSLEAVGDILEEVEGKTLLFTTLIGAVNEISAYLTKRGISNVACSGGVKDSEIQKRVDKFVNDPDCKVMVATAQKMGTGDDTIKIAQNVIVYDWNLLAGDLIQLIGRAWRNGQKNKVQVFEILQDNVFSIHQREKVHLQETIINQTEDVHLKAQDSIDLANLIRLAAESNLFGSN